MKYIVASLLVIFVNLISVIPSSACPYCPYPTPSPPPPSKFPCPPPHKPKHHPPPPKVKPPPAPKAKPPPAPKAKPPPPPKALPSPPPKVLPPSPPKVLPPPLPVPCPPPSPPQPNPPPPEGTCPIDVLKLDACVDLLGGLVHIPIGQGAEESCCPVLEGIADLDAAICLCTTIRAKLLNLNIILPIALEVLVDCGKHVPSGFQCPEA